MRFEVAPELQRLRDEPEYQANGRNARTLVKADSFRMVLVALKAGTRFDEGEPRGSVGVDVREGRLSIESGQEQMDVGPGDLAALTVGHQWSAVATEDSALLLTLSWPPDPADGDRG